MKDQFCPTIAAAEKAGIYLGAIAVMAKHQKVRVTEIVRVDESPPGFVRFARPLVTEYDRKFAKFGHRVPLAHVERAVLVQVAGVVAVDLMNDEPALFGEDRLVAGAIKLLKEVDWWHAEAECHLSLLRHRAAKFLAFPGRWRAITALSQLLMSQQRLSASQIRSSIVESEREQRSGDSYLTILRRDSTLSKPASSLNLKIDGAGKSGKNQSSIVRDAIVTRDILRLVQQRLGTRNSLAEVITRIRQLEPDLLLAIDAESDRTAGQILASSSTSAASIAAAGVIRCGLLVADSLRHGHTKLWSDENAETFETSQSSQI